MRKACRSVYRFSFLPEVTLETIRDLLGSKTAEPRRVCYITTSHSRIYMWVVDGELRLIPYAHSNNAWRELYRHEWNIAPINPNILDSEEALIAVLEKAMARQFKDSVMGFYDELPDRHAVLLSLKEGSTVASMKRLQFSVYETLVNKDPDWDGGVEIMCKDGSIVVPYKWTVRDSENHEHKLLLAEYAMFVPDNLIKAVAIKMESLRGKIERIFEGISIINIRNKIDGGIR